MPNFITDPQLDPYMVQIDDNNYAVVKNVTAGKSGKVYPQTLGFYSTLGAALRKIAKDDISNKDYTSIADYVKEFEQVEERLKSIVKL